VRHKRVVITHYGPEVITAIEEEMPAPKGGVRVKVLAAGVNSRWRGMGTP